MISEEIPVIDFRQPNNRKFEPETCEWRKLTSEITHACQTYGCFRVLYDHIPCDLYKDVFSLSKDIFDLPLETKQQHKTSQYFSGYYGNYPKFPLYESLVIEARSESMQEFVETMWLGGNPKAFETLQSFYGQLAKMDWVIKKMILEGLGVGNLLESLLKSTHRHFNLIKYRPPSSTESNIGIRPHTDFHFISMLFQDDVGGLELETTDGSWIPISPVTNSFIVVLGDSFKAWSNDRLEHARHRVLVNRGKERFSITLFNTVNEGVPVVAPEELVDSDHPRVFRPFDNKDFLAYFSTPDHAAADQSPKQAIYSYAGI